MKKSLYRRGLPVQSIPVISVDERNAVVSLLPVLRCGMARASHLLEFIHINRLMAFFVKMPVVARMMSPVQLARMSCGQDLKERSDRAAV